MKVQSIKKGFTLIELLVVITIIGILATGGVSVFTTQLQGARDSTRISDMKLLETGIHQFFNDTSAYPNDDSTVNFQTAVKPYLSKDLADPKSGETICWDNSNNNNVTCGWRYNRADDSFGLSDSAFKLGIVFEKKVNVQQKAGGDGGTGSTTNPSNAFYFETFAGAGAQYMGVWSGTAIVTTAVSGINTDMADSWDDVVVY